MAGRAQQGAAAAAATGLSGAADAPARPWPHVRRPVTLQPVPPRRSPPTALQVRVVAATRSAWAAYAAAAWGADELLPVTATARDYWHLGLTILDAADTLYLLGLADEYAAARAWVAGPALADFHLDANVSVFETTIRALGGLLGAYTVSADALWLDRAVQLGDRLLPAFDTRSGIPHSNLNLASGHQTHGTHPAEALSLGLEFRTLTYLTGDGRYAAAVGRLAATVERGWPADGLLGNTLDVETGAFGGDTYTAGNRVDSAYEYLAKQCLLLGGGGRGVWQPSGQRALGEEEQTTIRWPQQSGGDATCWVLLRWRRRRRQRALPYGLRAKQPRRRLQPREAALTPAPSPSCPPPRRRRCGPRGPTLAASSSDPQSPSTPDW